MSLLLSEDPFEKPSGEELTKGSSNMRDSVLVAGIIAAVLVALFIVFFVTRPVPPGKGEIVNVYAFPLHTQSSGFDANGAPIPVENFDRMLVFATVTVTNQSKHPLVLKEVLGNITTPDAVIHSSTAASVTDFQRLFVAYPQLASLSSTPLNVSATLDPGQTINGTIFSSFDMTKPNFDGRKALNFSFNFRYNEPLILTPEPAQIQQPSLALGEPTQAPGGDGTKKATAASIFQ